MGIKIPHDLQLLAPFCLLSTFTVFSGIFDDSYAPTLQVLSKRLSEGEGSIWTWITLFFVGTCFYRVIDAWRLSNERKITQIDIYFVSVLNGLALVQLASHYLIFQSYTNPDEYDITIRRMTSLADWSALPFFGWTVSWSRHVRRGWTPKHNWMACIVSSLSFFLCLIHRSSFYFLLSIAVVLSCIAVYETYKIHFYRQQVKPLFFALLALHSIFYATRLLDFVLVDFGWLFSYWFVTSFALITSLTNRLYLRILIDVNEHKH